VRKREHGTKVYHWKQLAIKEERENGEQADKLIPMMREYTVFNVAQCEGLPANVVEGRAARVRNPDTRDPLADEFLAASGAAIREGQGEAYYAAGADFINLPAFAAFKGADHFYGVCFHELTHWTGHKARLDRDLKGRFGQAAYAAEELIAELGAAFLAAEFSFDGCVTRGIYRRLDNAPTQ
jgi:antirestriction protein ArdC